MVHPNLAKDTLIVWALGLTTLVALVTLTHCSGTQDRIGVTDVMPPEARRALAVNACLTELVLSLPADAGLPATLGQLTDQDLDTAARLVEGVTKCREAGR